MGQLVPLRPGSLQTSGDNLLAFMKAYTKAPPLESGGVSLTKTYHTRRQTAKTWWGFAR
jgi:hypothetical protein